MFLFHNYLLRNYSLTFLKLFITVFEKHNVKMLPALLIYKYLNTNIQKFKAEVPQKSTPALQT